MQTTRKRNASAYRGFGIKLRSWMRAVLVELVASREAVSSDSCERANGQIALGTVDGLN